MKKYLLPVLFLLVATAAISIFLATQPTVTAQPEVVVYTSVDQVFSEPVLKEFEKKTGIRVLAVYDVEAAKTTGLVNRLIAEKASPRADLFWSGEFAQTILLKERGVLAPYIPQNGSDIPSIYKDSEGYWTGVGGRARTFLINTDLLTPEEYPIELADMLNGTVPGDRIGIAYPVFGTTATHAAALYAHLGPQEARKFFAELQKRGVRVVDGNSVVKDMVTRGELAYGLVDTDDACMALTDNPKLKMILPDQGEGAMGTLVIPNTVALIKGGAHPEEAKVLYEYLVSREAERDLVERGWVQFSLRTGIETAPCIEQSEVHAMNLTFDEVYQNFEPSKADLTGIFIR